MRHNYLGLLVIGTVILAANSFAADESPYEAVVLDQGAEVRAGPGQRFYVTQELEPGMRVEVYRREAGDWLAIRPPEGSFSWIPEADLEMTEEPGIAEITSEEAKSWIGSRAERIKQHKSHVALARGERVEVLGKKQVEGTDGKTQLWMKIAPPAGEFRWVQSRQVRRAKKSELAANDTAQPVARKAREDSKSPKKAEETVTMQPRIPRSNVLLSDLQEEKPKPSPRARKEEPTAEGDGNTLFPVRTVAHEDPIVETPAKSLSPDGFVARKRHPSSPPMSPANSGRFAQSPTKATAPTGRIASASSSAPQTTAAATGEDVSRDLEELDVQLSLLLSRDKSTWNFSSIKERVQRIVETAPTPGDRGQARFMLDKIKRFEDAFDVQSLPEAKPVTPLVSRDFRAYDAEGWLTTVKSSTKLVAPYALVDAEGKRICFVSPAPGLGVSSHLDKRVGLYGKRGLIPELNEPHVLASKVVDLDKAR